MTNIDPHIIIQSVTRLIIIWFTTDRRNNTWPRNIMIYNYNGYDVATCRGSTAVLPLSPTVLTGFDSDIDFSRFPSTLSYCRPAVVVVSFICPRENRLDGLRLCPMEPINSTAKSRMLPGEFCVGRKTKKNN